MAKTSYLNLVNRILRRINQATISVVTAATGQALIIANLINEAQLQLFSEEDWYSLFSNRVFKTVTYTASTIAFVDSDPDTITDSANGFGSFESGSMILVSGSASNDGVYEVTTAAAGTLTLDSTETVTTEAASESITITAFTYSVASDWGRTINLIDMTNNHVLTEDVTRSFDRQDPDFGTTNTPYYFAIEGDWYRLFWIPAGTYTIREHYLKIPATLSANSDTSDLPIECENVIIYWAYYQILQYMNKFDLSDRARMDYERLLGRARVSNKRKISVARRFKPHGRGRLPVVSLPPEYGHY